MPTSSAGSRIEKTFPGPGFLFPLLIIIIIISVLFLSSCFSGRYKSDVEDATNLIMENLKQGNYEQIPDFEEALNTFESSVVSELKDAFKNMEEWTVSVGKPEKNRVKATVNIKMNENNKMMDLFFTKIDGQWIPEKEISLYQSINFVPFIGAKTNP